MIAEQPVHVVYCLQGNGIDRADTAGCNGRGWREDVSYTLNTIDKPAVCYSADCRNMKLNDNLSGTLCAKSATGGVQSELHKSCAVYDARGNGDGKTCTTLTGDHMNRITDYTPLVCLEM